MTTHSTDPPQDRSEAFWREFMEHWLALNPAGNDIEQLGKFALESALQLAGGRSGWLETGDMDRPRTLARVHLQEEDVAKIRAWIELPLHLLEDENASGHKNASVQLPVRWSVAQSLLILPLIVHGEENDRRMGTIVLLRNDAGPLATPLQETLEHLANLIALQFDCSERLLSGFSILSGRLQSWETLLHRSRAGIFRTTETGEILQCNAAGAHMLGYESAEELVRINSIRFYSHPEDRSNLWRTLSEHDGSALIDAIRIRKDGSPVRLLQDLQLYPDEPGGAPILHGIAFELPQPVHAAGSEEVVPVLYRKMIEKQCDAIVLVDREARILFSGPSVERIFGYRPEEIAHHNGFDFIHPEDQSLARAQLRKLLSGTAVLTAALRLRHRNGLWRWAEMTASNQLDDPDLQGILLTYHDITERRQQEEQVFQNERRHQLIFEASGDVIWDWDMKTNSVRVSGKIPALFGYPLAQIESNASWWFMRIHPDDVGRLMRFFAQAVPAGEEFWCDEFRVRQADGGWGFAFSRGYILRDRDQAPLRMTGAMTDMTAHYRRHRLLEEGYGNISIGFLSVNEDGMLIYANPAARHLLQASERSLSGTNILHDPALGQFSFVSRIEAALREHEPQHLQEARPNGRLQVDMYPSRDGVVLYLQSLPGTARGPTPKKGVNPLGLVSHLPGIMSTLVKPFTHRRP